MGVNGSDLGKIGETQQGLETIDQAIALAEQAKIW
jgi:hypothetical protein